MKKILMLAAVVAMLAAIAGPASAADVAVFNGTANVGTSFNTACDASGAAVATGKGLYLPLINDHSGTFSLHTTSWTATAGSGLDVCGTLAPGASTLGASCGSSSGSGQGQIQGGPAIDSIGWPQSAGGTLPVVGSAGGQTVVGVVQAQGGAGCVEMKPADGATEFVVVGVAALV